MTYFKNFTVWRTLLFISLFRPSRGRNCILKCFFVQSIFADRYFHRRELRLVSLESPFSVEDWIKNFSDFRVLQGFIEVEHFVNIMQYFWISDFNKSKMAPNMLFYATLLKYAWSRDLTYAVTIIENSRKGLVVLS